MSSMPLRKLVLLEQYIHKGDHFAECHSAECHPAEIYGTKNATFNLQ
jgi:hypothetical protein